MNSRKEVGEIDIETMAAVLDSLKNPILFADTDHQIRYMNKAAIAHYKGGNSLIGRSLFDCHNQRSGEIMIDVLKALQAGEEEKLITDNEKQRIYMRGVWDRNGKLLGYYERHAAPSASTSAPGESPGS